MCVGTYIIRRRGSVEISGGRCPERLLLSISLLDKKVSEKHYSVSLLASAEIKAILEITKMCFTLVSFEIMHVYLRDLHVKQSGQIGKLGRDLTTQ